MADFYDFFSFDDYFEKDKDLIGDPISMGVIGYNFEKEPVCIKQFSMVQKNTNVKKKSTWDQSPLLKKEIEMTEKQRAQMRIEDIRMSVRDTLAIEYGYNKSLIEFEDGEREGYSDILINGFKVAHFLTEGKMEESDYRILDEVITTEYLYVGDTYLRDGKSREELIREFKDNNNHPEVPEVNAQTKKPKKT